MVVDRLLSLLRVEAVNRIVFRVRFIYFVYLRRRVRVSTDRQGVIRPEYSIHMFKRAVTSDRPLRLIRPLSVIDGIDPASAGVLSVGCRFETELLYLLGHGFRKVRGLDLIAYSPWVDVGNMHAMPYPDDAWDVVILGWVISYSETPEAAVNEILRITRRGGIVAVAVSYYSRSWLEEAERTGRLIGTKERIQTVEGILQLFDGHVDRVYFSHEPSAQDVESYCAAIFSIRK